MNALHRLGHRWLHIFNARNLSLLAGGIGLVYLAATITSFGHALDDAYQPGPGEGVVSGDYAAFYAAGRLVLEGEMSHLYEAAAVQAIQQVAIAGRVPDFYVAFRNPPFFAALFAPLAALDLIPSFVAWSVVSIGLLMLAVVLALDTLPHPSRHWRRVVLVAAGFCPIYSGLVDGQNAALSLLLYVLVYRALRQGRDREAGIWAALGLFKPQLFLVLPLVFAASRRWRALATYAIASGAVTLISLTMIGIDGALAWARIIVGFEPGNAAKLAGRMYSLKAFFDVLLPGRATVALALAAIGSLLLLALLARAWFAGGALRRDFPLLWAFTMLVAVLIDVHLLDYDLTVLVLPGLLLIGVLPDAPGWIAAMFLVTLVDVPLPLGPVNVQVGVILLAALAVRVWWQLKHPRETQTVESSGVGANRLTLSGAVYAS